MNKNLIFYVIKNLKKTNTWQKIYQLNMILSQQMGEHVYKILGITIFYSLPLSLIALLGSGALYGKMLLVRIIENNRTVAYFSSS